ncbi:MAG: hypothetical protein J5482_02880 [Oscillospiraceae bacterium]|nr:hypothetical protein [Oscillospiraceae bacterium]
MEKSLWARRWVRCPFWRGDRQEVVGCEGPFDGSGVQLTFESHGRQRRHMETFCCHHYEKCEVYRMVVEAKYPEE